MLTPKIHILIKKRVYYDTESSVSSLDLSDKEEGKSDTADDVIVDIGSDFDGFSNEYKVSRSFENLILWCR